MAIHADPDIEDDRIAGWAGHPDDHHDNDGQEDE